MRKMSHLTILKRFDKVRLIELRLLKRNPTFDWLGVDVAPAMIEKAKTICPLATFRVLDARDLNQLDSVFDAIICGFCIPYIATNDLDSFFKSVVNKLVSGAYFYLSFVEGDNQKSGFQIGSSGDRMFFNFYSVETIQKKLNALNMEVLKEFKITYPLPNNAFDIHTILILEKI
jgi:predicted TPR repeat methyltransferase